MEILSILNLTDWLPQTQIMQLIFLAKIDGVWSEPEMSYPISTNEGNRLSPAILQDGETLCFASRRAGGFVDRVIVQNRMTMVT